MARLTSPQVLRLQRAALLLNGFAAALSEHERETTESAVGRYRQAGDRAVVTDREWPVIEDSVEAMSAACGRGSL